MAWLAFSVWVRCMQSQIINSDANRLICNEKKYNAKGTGHSGCFRLPNLSLRDKAIIWRAKLESDVCFLKLESEHGEQLRRVES